MFAVSTSKQAFRTDDVDISATAGGYAIGWGRAGEYLRYSVDVTSSGEQHDILRWT